MRFSRFLVGLATLSVLLTAGGQPAAPAPTAVRAVTRSPVIAVEPLPSVPAIPIGPAGPRPGTPNLRVSRLAYVKGEMRFRVYNAGTAHKRPGGAALPDAGAVR